MSGFLNCTLDFPGKIASADKSKTYKFHLEKLVTEYEGSALDEW